MKENFNNRLVENLQETACGGSVISTDCGEPKDFSQSFSCEEELEYGKEFLEEG